MSYSPSEAILALIASSGPQGRADMMWECNEQCVPFPAHVAETRVERMGLIQATINSLTAAGLIECDEMGDYDLTIYGWELMLVARKCVKYDIVDSHGQPLVDTITLWFDTAEQAQAVYDVVCTLPYTFMLNGRPR